MAPINRSMKAEHWRVLIYYILQKKEYRAYNENILYLSEVSALSMPLLAHFVIFCKVKVM